MADDDLRQFMTDLLSRFDRSMRVVDRRLEEQTGVLRDIHGGVRANTVALNDMRDAIQDMRDAIEANTQGLLHVLDELRGRGPGPEAA